MCQGQLCTQWSIDMHLGKPRGTVMSSKVFTLLSVLLSNFLSINFESIDPHCMLAA